MNRLIIISNRLPVSITKSKGEITIQQSVGGLATGMKSVYKNRESLWIGWPGIVQGKLSKAEKEEINNKLNEEKCYPVYLSQKDINQFYLGFSNKTIWPLFHYFTQYSVYNDELWDAYKKVNQQFADEIIKNIKKDDIIWIHDYHFLLLPQLIRDKFPDITIGFFLHIPFPSFEVFRLLPWREEIISGMLGADLVGFHTYDYQRHFISSVRRLLGYESIFNQLTIGKRRVKVDAFPMGIDFQKFNNEALSRNDLPAAKKSKLLMEIDHYYKKQDRKIILSIDRLDYSKGIPNRLRAFEYFLEDNPEYKGKVILIIVAVPSRTNVEHYQMLKSEVDELVGKINGKHGNINWVPIWYLYRSLPFERLVELYNRADIALVTPLRDGMNLIAKEFIASKTGNKGMLILSEMAGAARELGESIIVNPNDKKEIANAIIEALNIPEKEQIKRIEIMQKRIKRYDVERWAHDFMQNLQKARQLQEEIIGKILSDDAKSEIISKYQSAKKRLLFLNYDGTLMVDNNGDVNEKPDKALLALLKNLSSDNRNKMIIVTGRMKSFLDKWFSDINLDLIAEYGIWIKKEGKWDMIEQLNNEWKDEIRPLLEIYVDRTPRSFIDEKEYSLTWNFSKSDTDFGLIRAWELKDELLGFTANYNLQILEGKKVVEVKPFNINKGRVAMDTILATDWDFILGLGNDWTDEYLFEALPASSYSIKVGWEPTHAKYHIESVAEVRKLLGKLAGS